jgi:hypothetical protein
MGRVQMAQSSAGVLGVSRMVSSMPECMNAGLLAWAGVVVDEDILM